MRYYIIAGEASGDLHGSNLMKSLYEIDRDADIRFWGGDLMKSVGGTLVMHYKNLAFMGFAEVAMNIGTILKNIELCKRDILEFKPDALIFIDYPGFNMRIAKWAKPLNIQTHYYISPQIWAWKENRIKSIRRDVDKMYVILPFEKTFYEDKHSFNVEFVGHPLIDAIDNRMPVDGKKFRLENNLDTRPVIAMLPGSRKQEISKLLPVMLSITEEFPDYQFVIAGAPGQDTEFYDRFTSGVKASIVYNKTYDLLSVATAALVTSGTATLETALFNVPEVVCYKGGWISYQIAKRVVKLKYISLVNLIMDEEVVTELIQDNCNPKNIKSELEKILNSPKRDEMLEKYAELQQKLGGKGASFKTANLIFQTLTQG